ncbi:MAG: right-handed parallel beta-helix repeat-containing protein [Verrucomicrobia bacterium]|nr:right-handed parallel beta-helix repeat-containing protein [Verrucomicrobiota bacterium]
MNARQSLTLFSFLVFTAVRCLAATNEPPAQAGHWLNVGDFGASGSTFETTAAATAGSKQITVAKAGDFKVGQGVMISKCNPQFTRCILKSPDNPFGTTPLGGAAELRGYNGSSGSWLVFLVEINSAEPLTFRWSDDMARTWKGAKVPVTFDWQPLSSGVEIKLKKRDWQPGNIITFHARDPLFSKIEKIEGNVLTLAHAVTWTVKDAVVRHCDSEALQAAVTRAVKEKRNVFIPAGHYRLTNGISVSNAASIVIEGASGAETVLDISEGYGTCVSLRGGTDVTVRNLRMVGHTGLGDGPGWHSFRTSSGKACWPAGLKPCSAMHITNTERVLVENCHASKMNIEAFYCQGSSRSGTNAPPAYTKSLTYLRCSATNCDGNGFNNNDLAENTSVLHCRIVDVGGCTWEGASRFVRFIGNYVRNSGTIAMGNIRSRAEHLEQLGSAQHIVADNVFEGRTCYNNRPGGYIVRATDGATQVIVRNNLFINYNSCGIEITPGGDERSLPTSNCTITGNIMDMTAVGEPSRARVAIHVGSSDVIVSDNQVYTRGACDTNVIAIRLTEPAINLIVHDNLLRNCGTGIFSDSAYSLVGEIVGPTTFKAGRGTVPMERRLSHRYRGWNIAWFHGTKPDGFSIIESFDPETFHFKLKQPRAIKVGDRFEVFAPLANWNLHDNTITGCAQPAAFTGHGSDTSFFRNNLIERGGATNAMQAITSSGWFKLIGNHTAGFDGNGPQLSPKP